MNIYKKQKSNHWFRILLLVILSALNPQHISAQNSMIGDGFGGNSGYTPVNYTAGSYSAYTNCNGTLKGWGANQYFQLGNGSSTSSGTPIDIITDVKYYSTGYLMGAIKNDNTLWAWGNSGYGNIATTPMQFATDVKFIDAGMSHLSYIKNDGTAWVIGYDGIYQSSSTGNTPHQVIGINNCVRIASGGYTTIAFTAFLLNNGTIKYTAVSDISGTTCLTAASTLTTIPTLTNVVDIKASATSLYALKSDGTVWSVGNNSFGGLGNGTYTDSPSIPRKVLIPNGVSIKAISSCNDGYHAFALSTTGDVYAWGWGFYGQLGNGSTSDILTPIVVATNAKDIMAGESFSYITKNDGTLWAAGSSNPAVDSSIWMNLFNVRRTNFTQINPLIAPMNLCAIVNAPLCNAGTTAPTLSSASIGNTCPATSVNLTTITASNLPTNTTLTWHTATPATNANKIAGTAVVAGTYYAAFFDQTNDCYSPTTAVTSTIINCPVIQVSNTCPSNMVNLLTAITPTNTPIGAVVTWHTGMPATALNQIATPTQVTDGTYYLSFYDVILNCYSPVSQAVQVSITICLPPIDAINDSLTAVNGTAATVITNDTLNGVPAIIGTNPGNVVLTSTPTPELSINPATGVITVTPNTPVGTYSISYTICEITNPTNCDTAIATVTVNAPDFTPTVDIDDIVFLSSGVSRDFVVNISEIASAQSIGQVVFIIPKQSAFSITYNPLATTSNVAGGTTVNNNDWTITENYFFITVTLKSTVLINANTFSSIGFTVSRIQNVPSQTWQPITASIVNGSGSDSVNDNNTYNVIIKAQ